MLEGILRYFTPIFVTLILPMIIHSFYQEEIAPKIRKNRNNSY